MIEGLPSNNNREESAGAAPADRGDALNDRPDIDGIEIIELLGKGGMSHVYKGRQTILDRIVAVKVLAPSFLRGEDAIKRFHRESKLTSKLEHPNVVRTYSFGISRSGQPYLVMEYLQGHSLAHELKDNGKLTLLKFQNIFMPILAALGEAHKMGIVHRDIKPANIMLRKDANDAYTVKVVDFGVAGVFSDDDPSPNRLTRTGSLIGTPAYMSPEQCQGQKLDGRSDLYSLACVMHETLSGTPPFSDDSPLALMQKHCHERPPDLSELCKEEGISQKLAAVIIWGLQKSPAARPQTAADFADKLDRALKDLSLAGVPQLETSPTQSPGRKILAIVICAAIAIFGTTTIILTARNMTARKQPLAEIKPAANAINSAARAEKKLNDDQIRFDKILKSKLSKPEDVVERGRNLFDDQMQAKKLEAAEHTMRNLIDYCRRFQPESCSVLRDELALSLKDQRKYKDAEQLLRDELGRMQRNGLGCSIEVCRLLNDLAHVLFAEGKCTEARKLSYQILAIQEKILGHDTFGDSVPGQNLLEHATNYRPHGKFEAKGDSFVLLASCYIRENKPSLAEPHFKRALNIFVHELPPGNHKILEIRCELANAFIMQGKVKEAMPLLLDSLHALEEKDESGGFDLAVCLERLAQCQMKLGSMEKALGLLKRASDLRAGRMQACFNVKTIVLLADCYLSLNKSAEAEPFLKEASKILSDPANFYDQSERSEDLSMLIDCYKKHGRAADAKLLEERFSSE